MTNKWSRRVLSMPTYILNVSMTGNKQQGFSLIELLVVLLIVGLMSSLVVVNFSGRDNPDEAAASVAGQLSALIRFGRAEAILSSTSMALVLYMAAEHDEETPGGSHSGRQERADRFGWLAWRNGQWVRTDMKDFSLPVGMRLMKLETGVPSSQWANNRPDEIPEVVFYPTGEITEFIWQLGETTIYRDDFGNIQVGSKESIMIPGLGYR